MPHVPARTCSKEGRRMKVVDMTETIEPRSDQMNSDDLMSGPRTFTISEVRKSGHAEQPVDVYLAEFPAGRPFKPSKSMRRVMVAAWGADAANYVGHRMTLYRDPTVRFGGQDVGGIRISHMSHIEKRMTLALTVTRGKRSPYVVEPLPDAAPASTVVSAETLAELTTLFVRKGIAEDARLAGVNRIVGGSATDLECITEAEARRVVVELVKRPDVDADDYRPSPASRLAEDDVTDVELPDPTTDETWGQG